MILCMLYGMFSGFKKNAIFLILRYAVLQFTGMKQLISRCTVCCFFNYFYFFVIIILSDVL